MNTIKKQRGNTMIEVAIGGGVALLAGLALLKVGGIAADKAVDFTTTGITAVTVIEANPTQLPKELCKLDAAGQKPVGCP
jgi:hypothetical protein